MGILRIIQITGLCLSLGAMLALGHQYYSAMVGSGGAQTRFVSATGETVTRKLQGEPTFIESAQVFLAGLTGSKPKAKTGLSDLHTRTKLSQLTEEQRAEAEMNFWMNFTSKLGFTGP